VSRSVTRAAIAEVSRYAHSERLKAAGFRRTGAHMYRSSDDLFHGIHFQGSQWGTADEGRFTVNLVVTSPALYEGWTGKSLPSNPATALFPVVERIGSLMPDNKDHWWRVSTSTDVPALAEEVLRALTQHALPFFAAYPDSVAILQRLRAIGVLPGVTRAQSPIVHAIIAKAKGLPAEAATQIQRALVVAGDSPFRTTVKLIARRLELP
jgi:hypothetical protein